MTRVEIRRRALRAAAAVSLTAGLFGCVGTVVVVEADEIEPDPAAPLPEDLGPEEPSQVRDTTGVLDDAVVGVAGEDCGPLQEVDVDAWVACCDANGWDWNKGCQAWGPPVPPAMGVV